MSAELRMMIESASEWAENLFRRQDAIGPMWHMIRANGEHIVMPGPDTDKDTAATIIRSFCELFDVIRCLFIDEAWIAMGLGKSREENERIMAWVNEHGSLQDYPGRDEVVVFQGEDADGLMVSAHRRIIRGHGRPKLGPLEYVDMTGIQSEGRLVGMLPRRAAKVH